MNLKPTRQTRAFTLVELLVVGVILIILLGMIMPATTRPRGDYRSIKCVNNLKNVGLAFRIYATDNNDLFPTQRLGTNTPARELHAAREPFHTFQILSNELVTPKIIICPADPGRIEATNWLNLTAPNVSYFINLDAKSSTTNWLSGDRNLQHRDQPIPAGPFKLPAGTSLSFDKNIHAQRGNLVRADGSVDRLTSAALLAETNHPGFTLAIP